MFGIIVSSILDIYMMRYFRDISISISIIFPGYFDISYLVISHDISQIPMSCDVSHDIRWYDISYKYTQVVYQNRYYRGP